MGRHKVCSCQLDSLIFHVQGLTPKSEANSKTLASHNSFKCFKIFSSKLDIRLLISVVITSVNLNKMDVHMKYLKIKRQPVHWFELTECGRNSSET